MSRTRVYHGFRSPYSRLGLHIVKRAGLDADIIAFTGPPDGVAFADTSTHPLKRAYYGQDVPRMTMRMGLPIRMPKPFDVDFAPANRALTLAAIEGRGLDFALAVSDARWGSGEDISSLEVLEAAAGAIDWPADKVRKSQFDAGVRAAMEAQRALIAEDGVFGVPFAVADGAKFWGHDRFEVMVEGNAEAV